MYNISTPELESTSGIIKATELPIEQSFRDLLQLRNQLQDIFYYEMRGVRYSQELLRAYQTWYDKATALLNEPSNTLNLDKCRELTFSGLRLFELTKID